MLLYVHIQCYQKVSTCVIVCSHPMISEGFKLCECSHQMISEGFKLCYCIFTSNDIGRFKAVLVLQAQ